jgi:AcrR family transcriptional regulator
LTVAARGRPRSERARTAILAAAGELMLEGGMAATTMEAIAGRAGVSKATIYKWWPSRGAVALDGFLNQVQDTVNVPDGVSIAEAMRIQLRALVAIFRDTSAGPLMRALVAQAVAEPDIADALREHWLEPRRAVTVSALRAAIGSGELRADTDVAAAADQLFGPIYHRLFFGHDPLDDGLGDTLVDQLIRGIGAPTRQLRQNREASA